MLNVLNLPYEQAVVISAYQNALGNPNVDKKWVEWVAEAASILFMFEENLDPPEGHPQIESQPVEESEIYTSKGGTMGRRGAKIAP